MIKEDLNAKKTDIEFAGLLINGMNNLRTFLLKKINILKNTINIVIFIVKY